MSVGSNQGVGLVPWWTKIAVKIVLSRLPVSYDTWRRLSLFRHGAMDDPEYAHSVFTTHLASRASLATGFVALELGPGDSVASALLAHAYGARRSYLVDIGRFAREDMAPYRALGAKLRALGRETPDVESMETISELLDACGSEYLTDGLASLKKIPDESVDFIWSQAVLEHVDRARFPATIRELRRVLRKGGVASHRVDLEDHLQHSLNHLRFSAARWESPLFAKSGFYTNRLRRREIVQSCEAAGFRVELRGVDRWDRVPISRRSLSSEFRALADDELRIRAIDLVLHALHDGDEPRGDSPPASGPGALFGW